MNKLLICGIKYKCLNDCLFFLFKFCKIINKINIKLIAMKKIPDKLIKELFDVYKLLAKKFFSKKTRVCLNNYCDIKIPKIDQQVLIMENKIKLAIIKYKNIKNYEILFKTLLKILLHFNKNYEKMSKMSKMSI